MAIKLARGDDALAVLRDSRIRAGWRELAEVCPWATGYQTMEFVETWYGVYGPRFEPVVVYEVDADDRLVALLNLAVERASGRLAVAGDHQAEYHAWLARAADGDAFAVRALRLLREHFPKATLKFRYLPPGAPLAWATSDPVFRGLTRLRSHRRPLVRWSDDDGGDASLAKKSNKSRLNRLKRSGEVAVREIEDAAALERVIDEIAAYYDLRQGAMNDSLPFRDDPLKRRFHLELKRAGVLHAATLTAGRTVAAAMLSVRSAGFLSVGVFAYSPFLARHSPGKFLVLMLGGKLAAQGYRYLDLTPGGAWKDRFATAWDDVHEAVVEFDRGQALRTVAGAFGRRVAKTALARLGITPAAARSVLASARSASRARVGGSPGPSRRVFYRDVANPPAASAAKAFDRDNLSALFAFQPAPPWKSLQEFLSGALDRLGEGERLYTRVEDGCLMHFVWMAERSGSSEAGAKGQNRPYPHKSVSISDPFTHPAARGRGYEKQALLQCLADAAAMPDVRRVYVAVPEGESPLLAAAVELGFIHDGTPLQVLPAETPQTPAAPAAAKVSPQRPASRRRAERARESVHSDT